MPEYENLSVPPGTVVEGEIVSVAAAGTVERIIRKKREIVIMIIEPFGISDLPS